MTKLEAVNEILEALGEPPVNALDTGGTSLEAEAEATLDREGRRIQNEGWYANVEQRRTLYRADTKLAGSASSGSFTFEETVTGGSSGATATFLYKDGDDLYVHDVSSTFTNGETVTGGSSGATQTFSSSSDLSESKIAVNDAWLRVEPARNAQTQFLMRGSFLYWPDQEDRHDEADGFLHDDDVEARIIRELDFADLTPALQDYVIKAAAVKFQRYKKRGEVDDAFARQEMNRARIEALQEDDDLADYNVLETRDARRVRGQRHIEHFGVN